jgi:hypothetical protein
MGKAQSKLLKAQAFQAARMLLENRLAGPSQEPQILDFVE